MNTDSKERSKKAAKSAKKTGLRRSKKRAAAPPPIKGLGAKSLDRKALFLQAVSGKPVILPADSASSPTPAVAKKLPQAGADGAQGLDIESTLRNKSRTVRASDLAARHEEVRVLGIGTVKALVQEAVEETLSHLECELGDKERQHLLDEAEEVFQERLNSFQSQNADLVAKTTSLLGQLSQAQRLLTTERKKVVRAEEFTVSDAGMIYMEQRLSRLLHRSIAKGGVSPELESEMRAVFAELLDNEREKIRQKAEEAQNDSIKLLERKIERLSGSLENTEEARQLAERRANALESAGGVGIHNIMEAGLGAEDPQRKKKLELLKEIVEGNRRVREFMESTGQIAPGKKLKEKADSEVEDVKDRRGPTCPRAPGDEVETELIPAVLEHITVSPSTEIKTIAVKRVKPPSVEVRPRSVGTAVKVDAATKQFMGQTEGGELNPDDMPWGSSG